MSTFTPQQTVGTSLVAWHALTSGSVVVGNAVSVAGKWRLRLFVRLGRKSGTAFTAGWPNVRLEASSQSAGNDKWVPLWSYQMAVGASIANTTLNGAITAGSGSCTVTSATNVAAGDLLFLGHTTDATKYEVVRVKGVSGTTVTFEENCTYAHDNGAQVTDQAEEATASFSVEDVSRIRVVEDNAGSGQDLYANVEMTTFDSVLGA